MSGSKMCLNESQSGQMQVAADRAGLCWCSVRRELSHCDQGVLDLTLATTRTRECEIQLKDCEGLQTIHRKAAGAVCDPAQQNREEHSEVNKQEQMESTGGLSWCHRNFHFMDMTGTLSILQTNVFNDCKMETTINGLTAGGCMRRTITLKEIFGTGVHRGLDLIVVWCVLHEDVVCGCWDYERQRQKGLPIRPGRQLQ
ncbi:hypothetical protein JOB18_013752 [Solea senegalensis]|uniref:Uncharacterized protein n=1 Tax=Solea senegalensis TaxID=28829 RepID=A0AAV6RHE2_SOLSE|nr:hypothetical protein JOB18_013752 [Solea senegalensis]